MAAWALAGGETVAVEGSDAHDRTGFEALFSRPAKVRGMERETFVEAAVSIVAVVLFLIAIVAVGLAYPSLSGVGPLALIGSIVFFIVVMGAAGYWLAGQ